MRKEWGMAKCEFDGKKCKARDAYASCFQIHFQHLIDARDWGSETAGSAKSLSDLVNSTNR